jgi:hypothetical protein
MRPRRRRLETGQQAKEEPARLNAAQLVPQFRGLHAAPSVGKEEGPAAQGLSPTVIDEGRLTYPRFGGSPRRLTLVKRT